MFWPQNHSFWTSRIYEGKWSYALGSVRSSVRVFPTILGNRTVDFSEIWHEGSLMVPLKSDGARFFEKKLFALDELQKAVFSRIFSMLSNINNYISVSAR